MADFKVVIPKNEIAMQISLMLNKQNKLRRNHTMFTILQSTATYFIEVIGSRVVGCTALLQNHPGVSKSFHTSVLPEYRGKGLGKKLLTAAINGCGTPYIYGTIRADNIASLTLVQRVGFEPIKRTWVKDHYIITVGRSIQNGTSTAGRHQTQSG
jgi:ribosomal protein S18 acetylase RimI-like enzyme